jgi:hypothetical protein
MRAFRDMNISDLADFLRWQVRGEFDSPVARDAWFQGRDLAGFLRGSVAGDIPIFGTAENFYMNSFIVPIHQITEDSTQELRDWQMEVFGGYGYSQTLGTPPEITVERPLQRAGITLTGAAPIVYEREFPGHPLDRYIEIEQQASHLLNLHWVPEESAWCEWGDRGNIVPVLTVYGDADVTCAVMSRPHLDFYVYLLGGRVVRVFNLLRFPKSFPCSEATDTTADTPLGITARMRLYGEAGAPTGCDIKGAQVHDGLSPPRAPLRPISRFSLVDHKRP